MEGNEWRGGSKFVARDSIVRPTTLKRGGGGLAETDKEMTITEMLLCVRGEEEG